MDASDDKTSNEVKTSNTKAVTLQFNPWWLAALLALACLVMLFLWRPWEGRTDANARTITVSGETTLKAEPDEYVFYPSYEFQNADRTAGLAELTAKSDEVVAGLKKAGVADKDIKSDAGGYRDFYYYNRENNLHTYTLTVTATTHSRDMAQKVQDYLVGTAPTGSVTPNATFSKATQKRLESQGRDEATQDARAKADQQAKNLGFKVGKVKSVQDGGNNYGGIVPMMAEKTLASGAAGDTKRLAVQPGQNDLTYTVQVVYYIK